MADYESMVKKAYRNVLKRDADPGGLQNYIDALKHNWEGIHDQASLEADLRNSDEYRNMQKKSSGGGGHGGGGGGSSSGGGGHSSTVNASIEASKKSARAQVDSVKELGPELAQHFLDTLKEFGPEFAQTQQDIIEGLFPEQAKIGENAAAVLNKRLVGGASVPDDLATLYRNFRQEADSDRGLLDSGMSSDAESLGLSKLAFDIQRDDINQAIAINSGVQKPVVGPVVPGAQGPVWNDYFGAILAANTNMSIAKMNDSTRRELGFAEIGLARDKLALDQQSLNYSMTPPDPIGTMTGSFFGNLAGGLGSGLSDALINKIPFFN